MTGTEIRVTLAKISEKSATGPDGIPANILKQLDDMGYECISETFNEILTGRHDIPSEWRKGRVALLEKPNSVKGELTTYRPITVSDVLYRVFTKILGKHIQQWMEDTKQLSEMQNGFRKDRRGEDNIFILTSAIESARHQKVGLVCVFLDASKAYDRVDRGKLWRTLEERGMDSAITELIRHLYEDNRIIINHGGNTSDEVPVMTGLRQGCPLSPTLYSLYIADLEKQLLETGVGVRFAKKGDFWKVRQKKYFVIPGLLFADDLVLMTNNYKDMETLLEVTSRFGDERSIKFNPLKSGLLVFSQPPPVHIPTRDLEIQSKPIPVVESYKYLGIELSADRDYLKTHWEKLSEKADKAIQRLNARTLWSFNKFEVSKVLWKATAVPQLTYCNAVIKMPIRLRNKAEVRQRDAGRWALGIMNSTVANEFIEGELGWNSFNARETISKTMYFERIKQMDHTRWPWLVLKAMERKKIKLKATERLKQLREMFGVEKLKIAKNTSGTPMWNTFRKELKTSVRNKMDAIWKRNMESKSTLAVYRQFKETRGLTENLYDNSRGSRLLALARAGMLNTRYRQHTRDPSIDKHCPKCGAPETDKHVILECEEDQHTHEEFAIRLGLHPNSSPKDLSKTKDTLRKWEMQE